MLSSAFNLNLITNLASRPASLQSAALSSLATLSLSSSPPSSNIHHGNSLNVISRSILDTQGPDPITAAQGADAALQGGSLDDGELSASLPTHSSLGTNGGVAKSGKKRGTIFTCESCSKVAFFILELFV